MLVQDKLQSGEHFTEVDRRIADYLLARGEGILAGISAGAALWAATNLACKPAWQGRRIVVLLPDTGDRYLSTPLYTEA